MPASDLDLIDKIKKSHDAGDSLKELVNRHSGIYFEIIHHLVPKDSLYCRRDDLLEDKEFNIYHAALKYNPDKGTKFSTFLGNETKWLCLNTYNKAKRKPVASHGTPSLDFIKKFQEEETIDVDFINDIYSMVEKHPDRRVGTIFRMRYNEGKGNKVMPWKYIAPNVNLSIQGCINVHNAVIKDIKRKLKQEKINE